MAWFALLKSYWWAVLVALVLGTVGFQHWRIGSLKADLAHAQAELKADQSSIAQLQSALNMQNNQVASLLAEQEQLNNKAKALAVLNAAKAKSVSALYAKRLATMPPAPANCASAAQWAAQQGAGLVRGWK